MVFYDLIDNAILAQESLLVMLHPIRDALLTWKGYRCYSAFLSRSQFFSENEMRDYQVKALRRVLQYSAAHVRYYRDLFWECGFDPSLFDDMSHLSLLPVLTKNVVRDHLEDFYSFGLGRNAIPHYTSGTTGHPFKTFTTDGQWIIEQGVIWRHWFWAGYRFRDKMAIIRSYAPRPGEPLYKLDALRNWMYFSAYHLSTQNCIDYLHILQKWKPRFLRGYPSSLYLLARTAKDHGIKLPSLRGAFTASETLLDHYREAIRDAFDIEVFDHYGQAECTAMLHECEKHEGMHIDSEYGYVELIPVSPGSEQCRLIATNLHNTAMPLIRYDTGDIVLRADAPCSCGRTLPLVRRVLGRQDDFLIHAEGYRVPTVNLYTFYSKLAHVYRFQVIQESLGEIEIRIQLDGRGDAKSIVPIISAETYSRLGVVPNILVTDEFIQSGEGKCLPFLQKLKSDI